MKFHLYPLSVHLDGEIRALIGGSMSPLLADWTGNHPYLIKLLLHYVDDTVATCLSHWESFVKHLAAELDEGPERQLLCYLIEGGQPVNPTKAQTDTGI